MGCPILQIYLNARGGRWRRHNGCGSHNGSLLGMPGLTLLLGKEFRLGAGYCTRLPAMTQLREAWTLPPLVAVDLNHRRHHMTLLREEWTLPTGHVGSRVLVFEQLDSTNNRAAKLACDPRNAGVVILADVQTVGRRGRGRRRNAQSVGVVPIRRGSSARAANWPRRSTSLLAGTMACRFYVAPAAAARSSRPRLFPLLAGTRSRPRS